MFLLMPLSRDIIRKRARCLPVIACSALLIFSGCATVGPDYVPPETKVPGQFPSQKKASAKTEPQVEPIETNG